jgi:hypothetical protein
MTNVFFLSGPTKTLLPASKGGAQVAAYLLEEGFPVRCGNLVALYMIISKAIGVTKWSSRAGGHLSVPPSK